jgi:hypothetical protein
VFQLNTLLREAKKLRTIKSANITKINEFCKWLFNSEFGIRN